MEASIVEIEPIKLIVANIYKGTDFMFTFRFGSVSLSNITFIAKYEYDDSIYPFNISIDTASNVVVFSIPSEVTAGMTDNADIVGDAIMVNSSGNELPFASFELSVKHMISGE